MAAPLRFADVFRRLKERGIIRDDRSDRVSEEVGGRAVGSGKKEGGEENIVKIKINGYGESKKESRVRVEEVYGGRDKRRGKRNGESERKSRVDEDYGGRDKRNGELERKRRVEEVYGGRDKRNGESEKESRVEEADDGREDIGRDREEVEMEIEGREGKLKAEKRN
jgi:hypothetical protein